MHDIFYHAFIAHSSGLLLAGCDNGSTYPADYVYACL